jgi:hypothetical protein
MAKMAETIEQDRYDKRQFGLMTTFHFTTGNGHQVLGCLTSERRHMGLDLPTPRQHDADSIPTGDFT